MKKLHSLFILSILALTMFVGCQMPTDGTTPTNTTPTETTPTETPTEDPVDDIPTDTTPTVDADETTYGFVKTVHYTVKANGQSLPGTKTGAELIEIAKEKKMVKDTDYTINGTEVILTKSGVGKYLGKTTEKYSLSVNASDLYAITGGGMKEAGETVTLSITHYDENENDWVTPKAEELYLVKVHIKEKADDPDLDIPVTVTKDHKIQFTMPEKNINVFAEFYDVSYQTEKVDGYKVRIKNKSVDTVKVVLCFNDKVYDNLEPVGDYFVLKVCNLENNGSTDFTETKYGDYELKNLGTPDDNHYMFGVIDNGGLKILQLYQKIFNYPSDQAK